LAPDIFTNLITIGVLKLTAAAKADKEGEGTGEVETVEDWPEGDDVYSTAKDEFNIKERPYDAGNFSFGD